MRARRGTRPDSRRHAVTPRDLDLLAHVARGRAVTTAQLSLLLGFGSASALHRRVRALHALGLVHVHVLSQNDPNLVTISRKGAELVEAHGVAHEDIHVVRHLLHRDRHAELIGDVRVGCVLLARRRTDIELECFLSDWDLRRAVGRAPQGTYIPDAIVSLRIGGEPRVFSYEIDRSFEPGATLAGKAAKTVQLAAASAPLFGFTPWRPVLLASSPARLRTLTRHLVAAGGGALWACGLLDARSEPEAPRYALAAEIAHAEAVERVLVQRLVPA